MGHNILTPIIVGQEWLQSDCFVEVMFDSVFIAVL